MQETKVQPPIINRFCCWDLRRGSIASCIFQMIVSGIALLMNILDEIDRATPDFQIPQRFKPSWRHHVWEGFLACNIIMMITHFTAIVLAAFFIYHIIADIPVYTRIQFSNAFNFFLVIYMLIEFGITIYIYSWYNHNMCRLAVTCSEFLFWLIRTCGTISTMICYYAFKQEDIRIMYQEQPYSDFHSMASSRMQMMTALPTQQSGYNHGYGRVSTSDEAAGQQYNGGNPEQQYYDPQYQQQAAYDQHGQPQQYFFPPEQQKVAFEQPRDPLNPGYHGVQGGHVDASNV